jgi:hypothetical protein
MRSISRADARLARARAKSPASICSLPVAIASLDVFRLASFIRVETLQLGLAFRLEAPRLFGATFFLGRALSRQLSLDSKFRLPPARLRLFGPGRRLLGPRLRLRLLRCEGKGFRIQGVSRLGRLSCLLGPSPGNGLVPQRPRLGVVRIVDKDLIHEVEGALVLALSTYSVARRIVLAMRCAAASSAAVGP